MYCCFLGQKCFSYPSSRSFLMSMQALQNLFTLGCLRVSKALPMMPSNDDCCFIGSNFSLCDLGSWHLQRFFQRFFSSALITCLICSTGFHQFQKRQMKSFHRFEMDFCLHTLWGSRIICSSIKPLSFVVGKAVGLRAPLLTLTSSSLSLVNSKCRFHFHGLACWSRQYLRYHWSSFV